MTDGLFWDDELEELANHAIAIVGEAVVLNTTDRVIRRVVAAGTGQTIAWAALRDALKAELRRLVTPQ